MQIADYYPVLIQLLIAASIGVVALASALVLRLNAMTGWIMWALTSFFRELGVVSEGMQTIAQPITLRDSAEAKPLRLTEGEIEIEAGAVKQSNFHDYPILRMDEAPKVRVVAVSPGLVRTEQSHLHYGDEAGIQAGSATVPVQRMATAVDIGEACAWLSSPAAGYASGTNLVVHGGGERPAFLDAAAVNKDQ